MAGPEENWINTILKRAQELRAAGVLTISIGSCSATLSPPAPEERPKSKPKLEDDDGYPDALSDPASYPGGVVPGWPVTPLSSGEDD